MSGNIHELGERESHVLVLLAQGLKTSEISKYLAISYHDTAELARMLRQKLGVSTLPELRQLAERHNMLDKPGITE